MEARKSEPSQEVQRLFSFGLIADVQYADVDDRYNFTKTRMRYYRNALNLLREAVSSWKESREEVNFVVQLGDLIDGFNSEKGQAESVAASRLLFSELENCAVPVHSVIGNHEFYNFNHKGLFECGYFSGYELSKRGNGYIKFSAKSQSVSNQPHETLGVPSSGYPSFYHFSPCDGFRVLFLDTYDLSVLGYDTESEVYKESVKILRSVNKNQQWNSPENLANHEKHFVAFNGGVGQRQLDWLKKQLTEATEKEEKVIIFAHCPFYGKVSDTICLVWNHQEVLALIHQFNTVVATFCGHTHLQGYAVDGHGIHHVVLPGIIETPPGQNGYATVHVYPDRLDVRGVGLMPSLTLDFKQ
ncbi:putative manganese-dependent ADP-ribose/CDP-alcohol diphosphatase [Apostichopus japonicus]|uniref:Putative manganese-dependent ADP-ribose/CDP-alcohol diphosphatase n=1 Tax=Stichopus japonicus TaxID=307972 RepID=A0A2G8KBU5_STIJA|nr:putative manganese-dependent ADP-ribose/CDP-alcohol diphosphatase [Apostichopus japonicus]